MNKPTANLIKQIERFCARKRMMDSAFGRLAMGDPNFVSDLKRGGRSPTTRTIEKAERYMNKEGVDAGDAING